MEGGPEDFLYRVTLAWLAQILAGHGNATGYAMTPATSATATALREAMIEDLWELGMLKSPRVEEALRAVPRHVFAPDVPLEEIYGTQTAVVTRRDEAGVATSSVSAPEIQALMLEQAEIHDGMNVLEIGSGGCNAAYLAELVGPAGTVTTLDIDPEVTDRASRFLDAAGYGRVNVVQGDAEQGVDEFAPYDRIIVTIGAWDIPPAWTEQLVDGGRIVVPLRIRGLTRSLALQATGEHLESLSTKLCGFIPIQGAGANQYRRVPVRGDEIMLRFDDETPLAGGQPDLPDGMLEGEPTEAWSGVTVGWQEPIETLQLWMATSQPGFCILAKTGGQQPALLADPDHRHFTLAAAAEDSFAYLVARPVDEVVELGARGFGPQASALVEDYIEQVRQWDLHHRAGTGPRITVWPRNTQSAALPPGFVITKRHRRVVLSW